MEAIYIALAIVVVFASRLGKVFTEPMETCDSKKIFDGGEK